MRQTSRGRADTLLLISGLLVTGLVAMGVTLFLFGEDTGSPGIVGEDGPRASSMVADAGSGGTKDKADRGSRERGASHAGDQGSRRTGRINSAAAAGSSDEDAQQMRTAPGSTGSKTYGGLPVAATVQSDAADKAARAGKADVAGTASARGARSMTPEEAAKAAAASRARRPLTGSARTGTAAAAVPSKTGVANGNGGANRPALGGNLPRPGATASSADGNRRAPNSGTSTFESADGTLTATDYTGTRSLPNGANPPSGTVEGAIDPDTGALVSPEGDELIPYPEVPGYGEGEGETPAEEAAEPEPEPEPEVEVHGVAYLQVPPTAAVGTTIQIPLIIDTTDRYLAAYGLELAWDNSVLSVDGVGAGGGAFDPPFVVNLENDKGQLRFNGISVHPTAAGRIPVATLTVTIHQAPPGGNATIRPLSGNQTIAVYGDDGTSPIVVPGATFQTAVIHVE